MIFAHERFGLFGTFHAIAVQRRAPKDEIRTHHFTRRDALPQRELRRVPLHTAHGGDTVRDIEEQNVLRHLRRHIGIRQVPMHLGDPGHEIAPASCNARGPGRNVHIRNRTDRRDAIAVDEHGLVLEHALAIHRDNVNIHEGGHARIFGRDLRLRRTGRGKSNYEKEGHAFHAAMLT